MALAPGTRLGAYEILTLIGSGGMGAVYAARDPRLGRDVAIKLLPEQLVADQDRVRRLELEARAAAALNHPAVVAVYDVGRSGTNRFIVMELLQGENLRDRLERGPLPINEALRIAITVAEGLGAAHSSSVIHRDIKPANIFLTPNGAKILDFGLAKLTVATATDITNALTVTQSDTVLGTFGYMAPEQARGEPISPQADVFSFGVVLYELFTARRLFEGTSPMALLDALFTHRQPLFLETDTHVHNRLRDLITRCTAPESRHRPHDGREVLSELLAIQPHHAGALTFPASNANVASRKAVAVLPFADASPGGNEGYFCEGMASELVTALGRAGVKVAARSSAVQLQAQGLSATQIAAELRVSYVIEGSVRRAGNKLRITVQLLDVDDGAYLWSERYDGDIDDVFTVQEEIAQTLVAKLTRELGLMTPTEPLIKRYTSDLEAYNIHLQARYARERLYPWMLAQAMRLYASAIERDPNYALAYAGLGECYIVQGVYGVRPGVEVYSAAKSAVQQALAIDPHLPEAHHMLGALKLFLEWDLDGARYSFAEALKRNPSFPASRMYQAIVATCRRRNEEADQLVREALALEPLSANLHYSAAALYAWMRRPALALERSERALVLQPSFGFARWTKVLALIGLGRFDDALELALSSPHNVTFFETALGVTFGLLQRETDARNVLSELEARASTEYVSAGAFGEVYAALGDAERACDHLEKAFEERYGLLVCAAVSPIYDKLRHAPRFQHLLAEYLNT